MSQWAETFETNVTSQFFMSAAFIPLLAKATGSTAGYSSCITNITSISGLMKGSSNGQFAYASSKAAMAHLSRMLATTLMSTKIRVNQVCCEPTSKLWYNTDADVKQIAPGVFPSEMTTSESDDAQKSELSSKLGNPAGKFLQLALWHQTLTDLRAWRQRCRHGGFGLVASVQSWRVLQQSATAS